MIELSKQKTREEDGRSGFPLLPRSRPEIDIEALLIWVYRDQVADKSGSGFAAGYGSASNLNAAAFTLGSVVDTSPYVNNGVSDEAFIINLAVERLLGPVKAGLVTHYARTATRPHLSDPPAPTAFDIDRYDNGKIKVHESVPPRGSTLPIVRWCQIVWRHPPESINSERAFYVEWWDALAALTQALQAVEGIQHIVTGPIAPREPWLTTRSII